MPFEVLAATIFGRESQLYHLFKEELSLSYEKYCRFLSTFFTASQWSTNPTLMYGSTRFNTKGLMGKDEYVDLLKQMDKINDDDESFWMKAEKVYNSTVKKIFLSKRGHLDLVVAFDDDKLHFNFSASSNCFGLKRCRHTKDNRMGFTIHTAGSSALGILYCVMCERENETQTQTYGRMMKQMFGHRSGDGDPDLRGVTFCSRIFLVLEVRVVYGKIAKFQNGTDCESQTF